MIREHVLDMSCWCVPDLYSVAGERHVRHNLTESDDALDARAEGYRRGWDLATSRAQSRQELGLPI